MSKTQRAIKKYSKSICTATYKVFLDHTSVKTIAKHFDMTINEVNEAINAGKQILKHQSWYE